MYVDLPGGKRTDLMDVWVAPDGALWVAGRHGVVACSRDGGQSWACAETGTEELLYALAGDDRGRVCAVGARGAIVISADEGARWQLAERRDDYRYELSDVTFAPEGRLYAVGWKSHRYSWVTVSDDGGGTWRDQKPGTRDPLYGVWAGANGAAIAVGNRGLVLTTSDGGRRWSQAEAALDGRELRAVWSDGARLTYGVGPDGLIAASPDGGRTWTAEPSGTDAWLGSLWFDGDETLFVAGRHGLVLCSRPGSGVWTPCATGGQQLFYGIGGRKPFGTFAVGYGGVFLRVDGPA
jgi:photosystem II stability/assembly factor-like uncharacterized protein